MGPADELSEGQASPFQGRIQLPRKDPREPGSRNPAEPTATTFAPQEMNSKTSSTVRNPPHPDDRHLDCREQFVHCAKSQRFDRRPDKPPLMLPR